MVLQLNKLEKLREFEGLLLSPSKMCRGKGSREKRASLISLVKRSESQKKLYRMNPPQLSSHILRQDGGASSPTHSQNCIPEPRPKGLKIPSQAHRERFTLR